MKGRLIGAILLAAGLGIGWFFIWEPLEQARANVPEVKFGIKAFLIVPLCSIVGLAMLLGGNSVYELVDGPPKTAKQWLLTGPLVLISLAASWFGWRWFEAQMTALGYSAGV